MTISWIVSNVSKEFINEILFQYDAALVWSNLKEQFDKINMSRIFHLHKAIVIHTQGTSSVFIYYLRLKDL